MREGSALPGDVAALEGARAEVEAIAAEFASAAGPIVAAALRRRLAALVRARTPWFEGLGPGVAASFHEAAERAIARAGQDVAHRLAAPDVWLEPRVAPGVDGRPEMGWDAPAWVSAVLRRLAGRAEGSGLEALDDPGHRVWVALLSAAKALDPVLEEFGLPPSSIPELGGGHYGLQPRTADRLDPSGVLDRLWRRYRTAYERYEELASG
jgi:hypothetical protein